MASRIISRHLSRSRAIARATGLNALHSHRWYGGSPQTPGIYRVETGWLFHSVVWTETAK